MSGDRGVGGQGRLQARCPAQALGCSCDSQSTLRLADTSTDEAALRRQEAMEALTKIEIGFAMLRDRLYVERIEEVGREGEMIYDGE